MQPFLNQDSTLSGAPPRKPARSFAGVALSMIITGGVATGVGYLIGKSGGQALRSVGTFPLWAVLLSILAACFLTVAFHELGHLLAGIRVGFRPYLFMAGPMRIEWNECKQARIGFNRDLTFYGGGCVTLPPDTLNLPRRFAIVLAGGPLMSLFVAAVNVTLAAAIPQWRLPLGFLGMLSLGIFVVTALPMRNGAFLTDGARWLQLRRGGPLAERDAALLHLFALSLTASPPADWSESILQAATAVNDKTIFEAAGRYFAYLQALDRKEIDVAATHLEHILRVTTPFKPVFQASYWVEAAWFYAWHRGDTDSAQRYLERAGRKPIGVTSSELLAAQAAIALRSGKTEEGKSLLSQAMRAVPASKTPSPFSSARLEEMRGEIGSKPEGDITLKTSK